MDPQTLKKIFEAGIKATLLEVFKACWTRESCHHRSESNWKPGSPEGQADVTALVIQELLGGDVMETIVGNSTHYYNRLKDGTQLDLTASQFPAWMGMPPGNPVDIDDIFTDGDANGDQVTPRFSILSGAVYDAFQELRIYWDQHTETSPDFLT